MTSTTPPEIARKVEAYIPRFQLTRLLNQDQAGRRISLLGTIDSQPALLVAERAAFATDHAHLSTFPTSLTKIKNLGANDIYAWFLANTNTNGSGSDSSSEVPPDFKLNLIYPCTEKHIKKYSAQPTRSVTETPEIYANYVRPWIQRQREKGALNWIFNILEGRSEQEDIIYRETGEQGFLLAPDLNWDRKTLSSLHLLALVERRDIWSVRDLNKGKTEWVKHMREQLLAATVKLYPEIERDQLKLYVHYQPTYHHFHIHIIHMALESGATQAVGKALGLENIISQLETMAGDPDAGFQDVSLTYGIGEQSELWEKVFGVLKRGDEVDVEKF
ncbi:scavenger mRNA decapping enzyme [Massarina eburnea CBS 473.64]|uniref:Scavenger mRNA decapping enzyme n=1 Tax=Massarina eburnea CBS 473.64 TaxID=1395130 RepID=A0A6A6SG17_9PLEO|nr:scavenger mRNA decapping enzyme [Massarina eburnea CBS 473.64]